MFKTMTVLSLKEGYDQDEFFNYHIGPHAEDALKVAGSGMKKYVINRVKKQIAGKDRYFDIVEMWWESKAAHDEYVQRGQTHLTPSGKTPTEDFESRGAVFQFKVEVEEHEIQIK